MSKLWRFVVKIFRTVTFSRKSAQLAGEPESQLQAFDFIQKEPIREELGLSHDQIGLIGMHTREIRQKHRADLSRLQTLPEDKRRGDAGRFGRSLLPR